MLERPMLEKTYLVAQRELHENVRTKTFWIGIFAFPAILTLMILVPQWLEKTKDVRRYAVVDRSGWLLEDIESRSAMPDLEKVFRGLMERYREGGRRFEHLPESLRETAPRLEQVAAMLAGGSGEEAGEIAPEERARYEEQAIEQLAAAVAGIAGPEGQMLRAYLPEEAFERLLRYRESIQQWWRSLPPEEAESFGNALAKSRYVRVELPAGAKGEGDEALLAELNRRLAEGELFAYFVIAEDPVGGEGGHRYVSSNLTDEDLRHWFEEHANAAVRERRLAAEEIDPATARWVQAPLEIEVKKVAASGEEEAVAEVDRVRQWAPVAFVYLLWMAVFSISQMLLTNTIEEKSNRIMEVLLSSISPVELMAGKILGIAATGLTIVVSWIVFFLIAVEAAPALIDAELDFDLGVIAADPVFLGSFVVYFLLGYLLYAALLVGLGSVCNSLKEAQNLVTPVTIVLMVPLFSMVPIGQDPNGTLARLLSYVPPFTPFVMMNRAAGPPSALDYALTTLLLLVSIAVALWAAAKVFRIGVLMTGKAPRPGEILRWLRAPVGTVPERRR